MRKLLALLLAVALSAPMTAQTKKSAAQKPRSSASSKRQSAVRKSSSTASRKSTSTAAKKSSAASGSSRKASSRQTTAAKKGAYTNESIRGLQKQRSQVQKKIRQQEQALRANKADVQKRLRNLMVINTEIGDRQKKIDAIQKDITDIESNISILNAQLQTLEQQLAERKAKYVKSMRYITRQHTFQDRLMFVLSAKNFSQMYRRMRFARDYAAYQHAQGDMVRAKQEQVTAKHQQLQTARGHKSTLLSKGQQERKALESQQTEQQNMVASLQKQQKTIQTIISQQKKIDAQLNAQIDRLIAIEVEKARQRAAEEARRQAAAAAAKKRAEELARKKAAAEAEARENARRIAEAKAREQRLKEAARIAAEREDSQQRERAQQAAREAEAAREAAERKAVADAARSKKELDNVRETVQQTQAMSSVDRMMSGGFEANKGRLPMPITGSYKVVSHFGQYNVEGLKGVTLDNKGINILGSPGAQARSIYDGEVSAVFGFSGSMVVMVRHGAYISVYCNLSSVSVSRGQKVSTRQALGAVGRDNILQFQLRHNMAKLNPEVWIGR